MDQGINELVFWFGFDYVMMVSGNKKNLALKRKELADLHEKYGLAEKAAS